MATEKELKEQSRQMLAELHQAVIGIPDNPDENGVIGDVKSIRRELTVLNGRTRGNEVRSKVNQAVIGITILGTGGGITKLMELW